jgi:hypothetical protein
MVSAVHPTLERLKVRLLGAPSFSFLFFAIQNTVELDYLLRQFPISYYLFLSPSKGKHLTCSKNKYLELECAIYLKLNKTQCTHM